MTVVLDAIRTPRLLLRRWTDADRAPFAEMSADPEVMRYFPKLLDRAEADAMVDRTRTLFERQGFGLWAVEVPGVAAFAGYVGLAVPTFEAPFTPCVEIGWRICSRLWRRGYATEGARAALDAAFGPLGLREVVSFTVPANAPSRGVMEKLGMTRDPAEDFDHPRLAQGHPLRRHVLYRMPRDRWLGRAAQEAR